MRLYPSWLRVLVVANGKTTGRAKIQIFGFAGSENQREPPGSCSVWFASPIKRVAAWAACTFHLFLLPRLHTPHFYTLQFTSCFTRQQLRQLPESLPRRSAELQGLSTVQVE